MEYLNGWTKQTVTNHVKKEFKGKSMDEKGNCMYRNPEDLKCIAGCFILDSEYNCGMEIPGSNSIGCLINTNQVSNMPLEPIIMREWQYIHDRLDSTLSVEQQTQELLNFLEE